MMILPHKELLLQRYGERIEKLSQQDKLSKFCMVVEDGQYFMTKDTEEFWQFKDAVACREYILPRDEGASKPMDESKGTPNLGPVLEVATSYLHGKHGVEIKIWCLNRDNSHSSVRISDGLNKLVTNLNNNEQETSEMQFGEYALKLNAGDFASRSKAKAKPQKREPANSSTRTIPIGERTWTDVEPGKQSLSDYPVSKKLIHLLRHRSRIISCIVIIGLTKSGRAAWKEEDKRKDFSIVLILQEQFCTSELFKVIQDAVLLILHYRTMSWFRTVSSSTFVTSDVQPIYIPSSIQDWYREGQILSNRQTVFFLPVNPMDKEHKDPDTIDLDVPRRAQYLHSAWKKHQDAVYWVDINLALKKGLKFYQTRSNAIILHETLPAYCIPKVVRMETGEVIHEKVFTSPRRPPKISLKHEWMKELGSGVARQPEGEVARQAKSSPIKPTNPKPRSW